VTSLSRLKRLLITPTAASISISLVVGVGALIAKVVGLGKELIIAYRLGAGPELDAFLYAYTFPVFLITIFGGAIAAALVPRFLATAAQVSTDAARRLASEIATIVLLAGLVLALVAIPLAMLAISTLAKGFDPETRELSIRLMPVLMPMVVPSLLTSLWSGLLNATHRFAAAAFVPAITPCCVVLCLYGGLTHSGALSISIGTVVGTALETLILGRAAHRAGLPLFHIPKHWRPEFSLVLRQFLPVAGSSLLLSATLLIDQSFAAALPAGSVSSLSYGSKLATVGASILMVAASTLALPVFSRLAAREEYARLRRVFFSACLVTTACTLPASAVLSFGAEPILSLLFERGNFSSADVHMAASVQQLQAWYLTPYIVSIIAVRALAAIYETWVLLVGSFANLAVDLLINVLLVPHLGVAAIGLASTAMYLTSALVLSISFLIRVRRRIRLEAVQSA
jgi:putative peptidoglycan lipid II flippase